jgi:cytochrome c553
MIVSTGRITCLLLSLFIFSPSSADSFSGDAKAGKIKLDDERCQECHGVDGNVHLANESSKIPKLAGQSPDYLWKQLQDFRSGERQNDFMAMMARNLDDQDALDIIAWYSSQPVMTGKTTTAISETGKTLFLQGDPARKILACAYCHGVNGKGITKVLNDFVDLDPSLIPIIGGQDWHYLNQQLLDWRSDARTNSVNGVMNKVTASLTNAEINALTDYISALE